MIKANDLREFRPTIRYKDGNGITYRKSKEVK